MIQIWVSFVFYFFPRKQRSSPIFGKSQEKKLFSYYSRSYISVWILGCFFFLLIMITLPVTLWQMSWTWHGTKQNWWRPGPTSLKLNLVYQNSYENRCSYWCIRFSLPANKSVPSNHFTQSYSAFCKRKILEWFLPSFFLAVSATKPCSPDTSLFPLSLLHQCKSGITHWRGQGSIKLLGQSWGCCFYSNHVAWMLLVIIFLSGNWILLKGGQSSGYLASFWSP